MIKIDQYDENYTYQVELIRMSDVRPEEVAWLWNPYIPLGKITILQGDPGMGKTYLATRIAALVTTGCVFPYGDKTGTVPGNGSVIFQTAEDRLGDTIRLRLEEAGADLDKIYIIDESRESLTLDDIRLREAMSVICPKLVVIDPLQAYLGSEVDMHRANEIRPVMSRLANLASDYGCAVILIGHQNKSNGGKNIYRGLGSIDIAASARSVLAVGETPGDKYRRAVVHIKSSLAPSGKTVLYELDPSLGFLWAGTSELTADDVLNPGSGGDTTEKEDCVEFLKELLTNGALPAGEVYEATEANGFSKRTVERAKEKVGIISKKEKGKDGKWIWELKERHITHTGDVGVLGDVI